MKKGEWEEGRETEREREREREINSQLEFTVFSRGCQGSKSAAPAHIFTVILQNVSFIQFSDSSSSQCAISCNCLPLAKGLGYLFISQTICTDM